MSGWPSVEQEAAVDEEAAAGHVARLVREEEGGDRRGLLGVADPAQQHPLRERLLDVVALVLGRPDRRLLVVGPGTSVLTRIPRGANSAAHARAAPSSAAFVAA